MSNDQSISRLKIATLVWFVATIALGLAAPRISVVILGILALGMLYWAALMHFVLRSDDDPTGEEQAHRQGSNRQVEFKG